MAYYIKIESLGPAWELDDLPWWKCQDLMETPTLCEHLTPLLEALSVKGARVVGRDTGWTIAKLDVVLSKGLHPTAAKNLAALHGLKFTENDDPHYRIDYGLFCDACKHGLSWPQDKSTIEQI